MFVFPMAGMSRRFADAGYTLPKYMLLAHGESVFAHVLKGFDAYFTTHEFMFIVRDVCNTPQFVFEECKKLGLTNLKIVVLDSTTKGQAETVTQGLYKSGVIGDTPITVFNIDTFRRNFRFPVDFSLDDIDGYLEVFRGSGENWSYVKPSVGQKNGVIETAEKKPISDLCCTGLYHFASARRYLSVYQKFSQFGASVMGLKEFYIAPIYNLLIHDGADIRYELIEASEVQFCGIPSEFEAFANIAS